MVEAPNDETTRLIAADYFEDTCPAFATHLRSGRRPPPELAEDNWAKAFEYAGQVEWREWSKDYRADGRPAVSTARPGSGPPVVPFDAGMVRQVVAVSDGNHDGPAWLCVGVLWDGRAFALKAGCDYTGWD